jgi:hypothetical protein
MTMFLNILLLIALMLTVYIVFIRPKILTWGASEEEAKMPLMGDDLAPFISATRAISINAPIRDAWLWVIQLGADRGGFFSYYLIEKIMGAEFRTAEPTSKFQDMPVGRIIPGTISESKNADNFNFTVSAVDPGKAFVLKGWGAFALKEIDTTHTRLVVRTHGQETPNLLSKLDDFIGVPTHYIMERRMLMGLKAAAEGRRLSAAADNLWLLGLVLSGIGLALMVFFRGGMAGVILSAIYGITWLWALLITQPSPVYSLMLFLMIAVTMALL